MKLFISFFLICTAIIFIGCGGNPSPEKLPATVKQSFSLLQKDPQFLMYINFKNLRTSDFWKTYSSDSVLKSENELGSILNVFKEATGVSISNGLDEFLYANSWDGENCFILKGAFEKSKVDEYVAKDSNYIRENVNANTVFYINKNRSIVFFFKEANTLCASNYRHRVVEMSAATDTTQGLLANTELIKVIENTYYKSSVFMVSNEKSFIRGIFSNFLENKTKRGDEIKRDSMGIPIFSDSTNTKNSAISSEMYRNVSSFALSTKIDNELKISVQFEFSDESSAENFSKLLTGIIALSKVSSSMSREKNISPGQKIINNLEIIPNGKYSLLKLLITKENIEDFRKLKF